MTHARTLSARTQRTHRFVRLAHVAATPSLYDRSIPLDPPDEAPPGSPEPWQAVASVRPDTAHVRALRVLDALGEFIAALVLIAGGAVVVGLATLV